MRLKKAERNVGSLNINSTPTPQLAVRPDRSARGGIFLLLYYSTQFSLVDSFGSATDTT